MKNIKEESCGTVDRQKVLETKDVIEETAQAGHLLSCGGVYLSSENEEAPFHTQYQFLFLAGKRRHGMVLKNLSPHTFESAPEEKGQSLDQAHPESFRKLLREQLN